MGRGKGKHRLYLAMYEDRASATAPGDLQIRWALLLGPKHEDPCSLQKTHVRYHAAECAEPKRVGGARWTVHWEVERRAVECVRSVAPPMLGRVLLGKVAQGDVERADAVLADPLRVPRAGDPGGASIASLLAGRGREHPRDCDLPWDCWAWVEDALDELLGHGLLQVKGRVAVWHLWHLKAYGEQLAKEIVARGLDRVRGMPVTVVYPGFDLYVRIVSSARIALQ